MTTVNIIQELDRLPLGEKLFVIERALKTIRTGKEKILKSAVDTLYSNYKNDRELTAFTQLDNEPFYETK